MFFIADLHIHSKFSRATSKFADIPNLYKFAKIKGINVLGTGDFTHPGWFQEIKKHLVPDGTGLFDVTPELQQKTDSEIPYLKNITVKSILSVEISSIYKKNDKVRKIHNVIIMPDIESVEKFNKKLDKIGNIKSDGRPILGLDSRNLLEIALETNPHVIFIPAHIWTPWFSLFGAKSGFDTIEECFEDLTGNIFALETGLSSDPPMNWRLSALDRFNLVSNSDAHSPGNLAREANLFNTALSYEHIYNALKNKSSDEFLGTLEFFPEEGKYHLDGHRNCGVRLTPKEAIKNNLICPVCGKPITIGVSHRVEELADRDENPTLPDAKDFKSLIPLKEIIADASGTSKTTKKVEAIYNGLISKLGNELDILLNIPVSDIKTVSSEIIAEGIKRVRNREVEVLAGFDGQYGEIKIFSENERTKNAAQILLLSNNFQGKQPGKIKKKEKKRITPDIEISPINIIDDISEPEINKIQNNAVENNIYPEIVIAGPGTGKTFTLINKIKYLITKKKYQPYNILAITFTNKAANEIAERAVDEKNNFYKGIRVGTFHSIAYDIIKKNKIPFEIFDEQDSLLILKDVIKNLGVQGKSRQWLHKINLIKSTLSNIEDETLKKVFDLYTAKLKEYNGMDYDDIILYALKLFSQNSEIRKKYKEIFKFILVDEFQDINYLEYKFVLSLSKNGKNLFVIGDPDQSIYEFRGADANLLFKLQKEFTDSKTFILKNNYRNPPKILQAALNVISPVSKTINSTDSLYTTNNLKTKINIIRIPTELSAGIQTAKLISSLTGGSSMVQADMFSNQNKSYSFEDIAVLVRLTSQLPILEETLITEGIPYKIIGAKSFLESPNLKAIINFLRIIVEEFNIFRFIQIINAPLFKLEDKLKKTLLTEKNYKFVIKTIIEESKNENLTALMELYYELSHLTIDDSTDKFFYEIDFPDIQNIEKLKTLGFQFKTIRDFLNNLFLGEEQDIEYDMNKKTESVSLITMHSAKGLEFPIVILFEVNEGIIPFTEKNSNINEERRLFYVAMTRAQEKLFFIIPDNINRYGEKIESSISRFIADIRPELMNIKKIELKKKEKENQLSLW